jgi:nucleotide-binding universal stress UspA family protein
MEALQSILFYSNPAVAQEAALRGAAELARHAGARITVAGVARGPAAGMPVPGAEPADEAAARDALVAAQREAAEALAARFREAGVEAQARVLAGTPFLELIREVLRSGHDLVVLAAEGRRGLLSRLFGGTAMHLMRKCPCPVWVVKETDAGRHPRILAAVDTTDAPWNDATRAVNPRIIGLAAALARMEAAELHVLQVWSVFEEGYLEGRGGLDEGALKRLRKATKVTYIERVRALMEGVDLSGVPAVRTHFVQGDDPAPAIVRTARREKADLLVMGTVSRTGLAGLFIGNTAEEVLGSVDRSVMTVKPPGFVSPVTLEGE